MKTFRSIGWGFTFIFFTLLCSSSTGQKKVSAFNSLDSITLGILYADTGAYAKAIALYETIPPGDTNYTLALLEDAVAKESSGQDSAAIILCRKGLKLDSSYTNDFYNLLATTYIDESHYTDAITTFQKSLDLDKYDPMSHYYLGRCCLEQGRLIPALLSLQFYLVLQPQKSHSYSVVQLIEQVTSNKYQYDKAYSVDPSVYHDSAFIELDLMIRSRIATNKQYKAATSINYNFVKQLQLFFEELKYVPSTENYWMENYVPFFTKLEQKNYLEAYLYFILSSVNDPNLQKDFIKNQKEIKRFAKWADGLFYAEQSRTALPLSKAK